MKKQLLIILLVLLCFACKKDASVNKTNPAIPTGNMKNSLVTTGGGTGDGTGSGGAQYIDLILQPRQPGQTYDTYTCTWYGIYMMVTGAPQWDQVTWPCLANGVPTVYGDVSVNAALYESAGSGGQTGNIPEVTSISNNTGQTVFNVQEIIIATQTNLNGSVTFGKSTIVNYQGELIRVTTGSHWAIATIGYPKPAPDAGCTVPTNPPGDI